MKKVAIFASGAGSNALNLIEKSLPMQNLQVNCLVVDTETSPLPNMVQTKYPHVQVKRILPNKEVKASNRKVHHESEIVDYLKSKQVEWILLAGYMRIIGPTLLNAFENRIVNIHPSLLPHYPGVDSYNRAFSDGVKESGVTVHIVDSGVDTGPIIFQEKFPRLESDTLADFIQRGKELEWKLYPKVLEKINQSASLLPGV